MSRTNKPNYRAELMSSGGRLIPAVRILGRLAGPRACSNARLAIVTAFQMAGSNGVSVIDLFGVTSADPLFAATVTVAIIERLERGEGVRLLVRPGKLADQLKNFLPKSVTQSSWNRERQCLQLDLASPKRAS